jgi:hypothetical protein
LSACGEKPVKALTVAVVIATCGSAQALAAPRAVYEATVGVGGSGLPSKKKSKNSMPCRFDRSRTQ